MNGGLAAVAFSFFKSNKIDYAYDDCNNRICFPCFSCKEKATMNTINTTWRCDHCDECGTLKSLIQWINENGNFHDEALKQIKIYNPRKEGWQIRTIFRSIIGTCEEEKMKDNLIRLFEKVDKYIAHK